MNTIQSLVNDYYTFLKDNTVVMDNPGSGWTLIGTPLLDTFNDTIDLYAKRQNGHLLLSDDGQTLRNLELCGVSVTRSNKRKQLLKQVLLNYGVQWQEESRELLIKAKESDFPQKKFNLLSAIVEINNLYVFSKHTVASAFAEDVAAYLDKQNVVYTPHFISRGAPDWNSPLTFKWLLGKRSLLSKHLTRSIA
jgi:hypothetical protein